jgi:hypothetical protein
MNEYYVSPLFPQNKRYSQDGILSDFEQSLLVAMAEVP